MVVMQRHATLSWKRDMLMFLKLKRQEPKYFPIGLRINKMAEWIESHPALENHPKRIKLSTLLKLDKRSTIGLLHLFWWWGSVYAEDGDLRKYGMGAVNEVLGLPLGDFGLVRAGFIDRAPHLRIHDWFHYYGRYLKLKYRNNHLELKRIEDLCSAKPKLRLRRAQDTLKSRLSAHTDVPDVRTYGQTGRTDVQDVPGKESRPAPGGASAPEIIKNYEDAKDDELCGPPPGWSKKLRGGT